MASSGVGAIHLALLSMGVTELLQGRAEDIFHPCSPQPSTGKPRHELSTYLAQQKGLQQKRTCCWVSWFPFASSSLPAPSPQRAIRDPGELAFFMKGIVSSVLEPEVFIHIPAWIYLYLNSWRSSPRKFRSSNVTQDFQSNLNLK